MDVLHLREKGEGAICELCVLVDDIEKAREQVKSMGITPMDRFKKPLEGRVEEAPSGSRYFYLPAEETSGTWIEILQRPWLEK